MNYRTVGGVVRALFRPRNYRAVWNIFRFFDQPGSVLRGYLAFSEEGFPRTQRVNTPMGQQEMRLHSAHDLITAVECFAKLDYEVPAGVELVVDMGSNIGISAIFFLSRNPKVRVHLYEPVPANVERLEENLAPFQGRFELHRVAVGSVSETATFGTEPTGRYGGLGADLPETIEVDVVNVNEAITAILEAESRIDALKLDVEGMERPILLALDRSALRRIGTIFAETPYPPPELDGFSVKRRDPVMVYERDGPSAD